MSEEIFTSSFAAAAYLKSINLPTDKKVYVIGEDGILKELELAGFQYLGGPDDGGKKIGLKPGFLMEHDKDVKSSPLVSFRIPFLNSSFRF
ncbi:HAD-superfamily hydrolase, subfamily IIA [Corchorus olitorius]|uniref:HAD-superfamily hydrolase, subfamily IIA n=1 Tax=Corchorus olitorius TaxID=93759 RepID=A0A1R3HJF4_9ROSI|nr:HAD-superfamily hydrolase, subfamily IIA [Corchorus olitorius]